MSTFSLPISESELQALALRRAGHNGALADEAAQHVRVQCLHGKFDPTRCEAPICWVDRCLINYMRDALRRPIRAVGGGANLPDAIDTHNDFAAVEQALDLTTPFGRSDLATISRWRPRERVLLLCRGLLWRKVPTGLWRETTSAVGLPPAFPGEGFADLAQSQQIDILARALNRSESNLCHQWKRRVSWLQSLQFVRDLARK